MPVRAVVTAAEIFEMIRLSGIPDGPPDYDRVGRPPSGGRRRGMETRCSAGKDTTFWCVLAATRRGLCTGHAARQRTHGSTMFHIPLSRSNRRGGGLGRAT